MSQPPNRRSPSKRSIATKQAVIDLLDGDPTPDTLNAALHHLALWRTQLLQNTVESQSGKIVQSGPFAGMIYDSTAHASIPRLLGSYEATLTPVIEHIIASTPPLIMDIGCNDGFYAVGFARRLRDATIWARDSDPDALDRCTALAVLNDVPNQVKTGGKLTHADFDICRAQATTILCDIGGGEASLLDPDRAKGLRRANLLVEVHEAAHPGLCDTLTSRFSATHEITRFDRHFDSASLPDWMEGLSDLDRHLALWEARTNPTPWLWLEARHR